MIKDNNEHEKNKLLFLNNGNGNITCSTDQLDHHNPHYNQNYLQNDSSTTLISNNKMTNSIRMAYPNPNLMLNNGNHAPINEIYANHSLLTTTSTTTGSYLANANNNLNNQAIAIDTSNHTPRFHLLNQNHQQNPQDCYYDDLRYNHINNNNNINHNEEQSQNHYSSPYRQHQHQQSYSPLIRRDDPTIPLYATLKPKLIMQQQQHQQQRQFSNNYAPFSTLYRNSTSQNTPPLPMPRKYNTNNNGGLIGLPLPPPPPPPPPPHHHHHHHQPPLKPKRTFEYVIGSSKRDLHSESGAFLLSNEDSSTPPIDFYEEHLEHLNEDSNVNIRRHQQGSTTSLDEEDLDLNDLKDFEDVTFDNLRKPGEVFQKNNNFMSVSSSTNEINPLSRKKESNENKISQKINYKVDDLNAANQTNSEQSLLLKSEKSSSNNTINNNEGLLLLKKGEFNLNDCENEANNENDDSINKNVNNSKIYEETEI